MNIKVNENRLIDFSEHEQGTSNETNIQKLQIEVPEQYNDFYKKIVFVTEDGNYWDYLEEDGSYILKSNVTKFSKVDFYIWLSKTENEITQDFRSKTYPLFFNENLSPDGEVPEEQETEMERVIRILEEEITKTNNLNITANKIGKVTTVEITNKDGEKESVQITDGTNLEYNWDGTSLGIKTDEEEEYEYVDLKGEKGDCNFATFEINDNMELVMNKTDGLLLDFRLNENSELEVII